MLWTRCRKAAIYGSRPVSADEPNQVRIVVRDDGSGIPPEILPRIFEPFLTTKETGRGVGLGLAISHSILERHNGNIEVQSEVGTRHDFYRNSAVGRGRRKSRSVPGQRNCRYRKREVMKRGNTRQATDRRR